VEAVSQQVLPHPAQALRGVIGSSFELLLDRGRRGGNLRLGLVLGSFALAWSLLTLVNLHNVASPVWLTSLPFPLGAMLDLGAAFFAPGVLTRLVPIAAGLWLGYRIAAHYLTDLLELEHFPIASHYLRASLFGIGYDVLQIDTGELAGLDVKHPLVGIGGPGYIQVNLGYAAVVEDIRGIPRVIGPTPSTFIAGFERIRDVIDLRDQLRSVDEVRAVTRDGIEVWAREAQMVFRVFSGGKPRSLADPYPYSEEAVRRLAYGQAVTEGGPRRWTENLKDLISREIMAFVSGLTIEEFMALQPGPTAVEDQRDKGQSSGRAGALHIPRRDLTERFHTPEARRRMQDEGLELAWVGVGTWEVGGHGGQEGVQPLGETLIGAWLDLQRAKSRMLGGTAAATGFSQQQEIVRGLLSDMVELWQSDPTGPRNRCLGVIGMALNRLREMLESGLAHEPAAPPADLRAAMLHLARLIPSTIPGGET
jgi:hypothetical protein